ncbi:Uncharacterized conserved protein YndB, AHSA1/START domain [Mucilaginibacter pineti]|uniref:Uncharacterized conserved protein YndB, AHSA1/START domain n=1 Tax=Mucilaginibacter pineti TaxID=1391627 RepID=A0A1G7M1S1_9SPHI|nr:SRPBCC domain-containing protein [Mucilaginibacter pineti]SDF55120.1 Uncharacterized conserved protein YndB, AHSA1/START domain [Mucilaginibacter pineti]
MEITVETTINLPVDTVWKLWTTEVDVKQWNKPSDDWHTTKANVDFKEGGKFLLRMELKNGQGGFDHAGVYNKIIVDNLIDYTGVDGRRSTVTFIADGERTRLTETFQPEEQTPLDVQRAFCQGVLNNFKTYAETKQR